MTLARFQEQWKVRSYNENVCESSEPFVLVCLFVCLCLLLPTWYTYTLLVFAFAYKSWYTYTLLVFAFAYMVHVYIACVCFCLQVMVHVYIACVCFCLHGARIQLVGLWTCFGLFFGLLHKDKCVWIFNVRM